LNNVAARKKLGNVGSEARILDPADQTLAHDDMRRKVFHHDHRLLAVEMENLRRQARGVAALFDERVVFEPRALERQWPGFADEAHIGQRLLDHEPAGRPLDDEDEIEVAVADLAHALLPRRAAELRVHVGQDGKDLGKLGAIDRRVGCSHVAVSCAFSRRRCAARAAARH
jgi:hypothetical protein